MVAFPNTLLVRAERDYLVDPGLIMQGGPVFGALDALGVDPGEIKDVILTHLHFDHAEGLAAWPQRRAYVHRLETEAPYAQIVSGVLEMVEPRGARRRGGRDRAGAALAADAGPLRRPDLAAASTPTTAWS